MVWITGSGVTSENIEDYVAHVRNECNKDKLWHFVPKPGARNLDQGFLDDRDTSNEMATMKEVREKKPTLAQKEWWMNNCMRSMESKIVEYHKIQTEMR